MSNQTKSVNKVVLRDNVLDNVKHAELYKTFREEIQKKYDELEKKYFSAEWIKFGKNNESGYWNKNQETAIPVQKSYGSLEAKYFDIDNKLMSDTVAETLFDKKSNCPNEIMNGIKASRAYDNEHWVGYYGGSFSVDSERHSNWNDNDSIPVGSVSISKKDFKERILCEYYSILTDDTFKKAVAVLKTRKVIEVSESDIDKLLVILNIDRDKITKEVTNKVMNDFVMSKDIIELYTEGLLECDTRRADLEKYDSKILTDVNSGHWDLWSDGEPVAEEGQVLVELESPLRARNPVSDVHQNGLIGIDFGTKSTIVSVRDGHAHTTLLRVGIGKLNSAPKPEHYENPTIMEFINFEKFISDYNSRTGRPETSIEDIRVSHSANNDLKSCERNEFFDSFLYDIKQWCGDSERIIRIIDQQTNTAERTLPVFASLNHDEFNPVELYAYYIGLYINNMHSGIYTDYVLSYPVNYDKDVKNKIRESFEDGLWKSLPETVQNDAEIKKRFRVKMGVSEPAAYAIIALKGYGFDPDDADEKVFYSIFDFGGGTTDFDFGIWRGIDDSVRAERDKDYVIEHINSEGDKYLGGENLLELLAFEVFKANNDFMREGKENKDKKEKTVGFSYTLPHGCIKPSGCEMTIKESPSAKRNTKQLMEVLRPFWEGIIAVSDKKDEVEVIEGENTNINAETSNETKSYNGYIFRNDDIVKFPIDDEGFVKVDLFDNDGNIQKEQRLYIKNKSKNIDIDLVKVLEDRIERGVQNFFKALLVSFNSDIAKNSCANEIMIFLAGNSSKSPILKKIFEKYISEKDSEIKDDNCQSHFKLFPPLGTKEAIEIQKELGLPINTDISAPTGKTGVAYGLIEGRDGGKILVKSDFDAESQTKFRYNIGSERKSRFWMKLDRNEICYGEWVDFCTANEDTFEIYYTSLPAPHKTPIDDPAIHTQRGRIDAADSDADIFIRTVESAPNKLEYCVAGSADEINESTKIYSVCLDE